MKYADISKLKHTEGYMPVENIKQSKDKVFEIVVQERKPRTHYLHPVSENYTRQQRMNDFMSNRCGAECDLNGKDVF